MAGTMPQTIAQRELRNDNARVIAAVAAGETFVITRNGTPVAELRPVTLTRRRIFVPKSEVAALALHGPHIGATEFRQDLERFLDQRLADDRGTG